MHSPADLHPHTVNRASTKNHDRVEPDRFNIIYADPPWRFQNWSMAAQAVKGEKWGNANGRPHYDCMDHKE